MSLVGCTIFKSSGSFDSFDSVRNEAESLRQHGMIHQFWGVGLGKPNPVHWLLVWDSGELDTVQALIQTQAARLDALKISDGSPTVFTFTMRQTPIPLLRAPVSFVAILYFPAETVEQAKEGLEKGMALLDALKPEGYHGRSTSTMVGGQSGLYVAGWDSVEQQHAGLQDESETGVQMRQVAEDTFAYYSLEAFHVEFKEHVYVH